MLSVNGRVSSRRTLLLQLATLAIGGVAAQGCAALIGVQDAEAKFLVKPRSDGTFFGWSEMTVDQDVNSVESALLVAITLDVEKPEGTPDMTFLGALLAEAVTAEARTRVASLDEFPKGEQAVIMKKEYTGDLKPLFKDEHTIRIEWTGSTNPSFTAWPAEGFWVRVRIKVDIS